MARRTIVTLEDDIDGGDATQTVRFGLDGTGYEIDLNDANAANLRDAFAPYVGHARKAGRATARPGRAARSAADLGMVREWARTNGLDVNDRGRIPASVQDAYDAAH